MDRRITSFFLLFTILIISACGGGDTTTPALPTLISTPLPRMTATRIVEASPAEVTAEVASSTPQTSIAGILEHWIPATGTLTENTSDRWRFTGLAGDQIRVRVLARTFDVTLSLLDESGAVLLTDEEIEATLTADGVYTVTVTALEGAGDYEIGLSYTDRPNPLDVDATPLPEVVGVPTPPPDYADIGDFISSLDPEITVGGTLDPEADSHVYTFEGSGSNYVTLEMRRVSGMIDPVLTLYDPEGVTIAIDDDSGGEQSAMLRNIRLPQDGIYTVEANGSGLGGGYSLLLLTGLEPGRIPVTVEAVRTSTPLPTFTVPTPAPAVTGNRLEDHTLVTSTLDANGVSFYPMYLPAGQPVTIGASPAENSTLQPEIEVISPEGVIVANARSTTSNAGGDALIMSYVPPLEGTYQIIMRGENNSSGAYTLSYGLGDSRFDVLRAEASFDVPNTAIIEQRGMRHVWTVRLRAGDVITANVNPGPSSILDPVVDIVPVDEPSLVIATDDNGGGGRSALLRDVAIPRTGLYLLRVWAAGTASLGDYTLIWRYVNVAPTITPPPARSPVLEIQDTVPPTEYRFYPFYGLEGQRVRVRVVGQNGFDPVGALVGPDGTVLTEVDDTDGDLNPNFTYELATEGTYNVRVNGYIDGGAYEVIVEVLY